MNTRDFTRLYQTKADHSSQNKAGLFSYWSEFVQP